MDEQPRKQGIVGGWLFGIVTGLIVIALLIAAYSAGKDKGRDDALGRPGAAAARPATTARPAPAGPGRKLFVTTCGSCHTLKAAGTQGTVGPKLDDLKPDEARVLAAIRNGGAGSGAMPKGLVAGARAREIAKFVAAASGGG